MPIIIPRHPPPHRSLILISKINITVSFAELAGDVAFGATGFAGGGGAEDVVLLLRVFWVVYFMDCPLEFETFLGVFDFFGLGGLFRWILILILLLLLSLLALFGSELLAHGGKTSMDDSFRENVGSLSNDIVTRTTTRYIKVKIVSVIATVEAEPSRLMMTTLFGLG